MKPKLMSEVAALRRRFREWSAERGDKGPMPGPWARRGRPAKASEARGEGKDSGQTTKTRQRGNRGAGNGKGDKKARKPARKAAKGISLGGETSR